MRVERGILPELAEIAGVAREDGTKVSCEWEVRWSGAGIPGLPAGLSPGYGIHGSLGKHCMTDRFSPHERQHQWRSRWVVAAESALARPSPWPSLLSPQALWPCRRFLSVCSTVSATKLDRRSCASYATVRSAATGLS